MREFHREAFRGRNLIGPLHGLAHVRVPGKICRWERRNEARGFMLQCVTHCRFCNPEALHEDQRDGRESQDPDQARGARLGGQFDHRPGRYHVKIWTRAWRHVWAATLLRKQPLYSLLVKVRTQTKCIL